ADLPDGDIARTERDRLRELRRVAVEDRVEADLGAGRHSQLVGELEGLVSAEPLRERRTAQLMLALYRSGRQVDALRAYQAARRCLQDELGLEPGAELRRLEAAILAHAPRLDGPRGPGSGHVRTPSRRQGLPTPLARLIGRTAELDHLD